MTRGYDTTAASDALLTWALVLLMLYRARSGQPRLRSLVTWMTWRCAREVAYAAGRVGLAAETAYRSSI